MSPHPSTPVAADRARVRILLVEDHPMFRQGMRALLESTHDLQLCAEAETPAEALVAAERERPDVICLELLPARAEGLALIRRIQEAAPGARVLVVSVRDEEIHAERCLQAGALGYVMKTEPNESLLAAVRRVADGKIHLSPRLAMKVLNSHPELGGKRTGIAGLTDREMQVFRLIGLGSTTRQISERLGIGIKTVETHRENIKNKLRIDHSTALVREATRWLRQEG